MRAKEQLSSSSFFVFLPIKFGKSDGVVPSLPADKPSGFVMPVLFFRRCFLRLACGEGGGSSLGLVALPVPEPAGSLVPFAGKKKITNDAQKILLETYS